MGENFDFPTNRDLQSLRRVISDASIVQMTAYCIGISPQSVPLLSQGRGDTKGPGCLDALVEVLEDCICSGAKQALSLKWQIFSQSLGAELQVS